MVAARAAAKRKQRTQKWLCCLWIYLPGPWIHYQDYEY